MARVEREIEINTPQKRIFDVLNEAQLGPKWNLSVNEINEISEGKYAVKSTIGDFTSIRTETVEPERISFRIEGGIFNSMGYIINPPKGDMVEVKLWGEFDDEKNEKILVRAGEILLKCLKNFSEFLEEGGDPEEFDKKQITVAP
ncbi:MAG: SRPBCC family protein [Promethearchaeota archaeon]